ncbi:hypothetical protein FHR24_003119 [Wenyingzhuangia heitensis]|uniref:AhpC/TSA family protein n=1 Tax=Wenyingzhuangia heitensis TaxID=1487859 RepID=A0ABX0UCR0_9FLAO|nr:hypothetical protein [Wenyingzhuangia heitensis]NIJ46624.1 hypothetical protein [Wenyingzhuangia heitensis]
MLIYKELIKSSNKIIYPTSKKDFTFKSLKKKVSIKPLFLKLTYVLYIDNLKHCRPCIDTFIETFKKQSLLHPNLNYVLICKNFNEKELDILINDKNLELPIYTITNDKSFFLKMMDETSFPFYFTINNSLDISNVFLPSKKRPELNTIYFNNINENY